MHGHHCQQGVEICGVTNLEIRNLWGRTIQHIPLQAWQSLRVECSRQEGRRKARLTSCFRERATADRDACCFEVRKHRRTIGFEHSGGSTL